MALEQKRAAFFDVDNTLIRGSTIYFLGRGMYQRGYFTKADISRFVLANLRFRLTGTEKKEEIAYAKTLCGGCPVKKECLEGALSRQEPCGVWGGELFEEGSVIAEKRLPGRPRLNPQPLVATA